MGAINWTMTMRWHNFSTCYNFFQFILIYFTVVSLSLLILVGSFVFVFVMFIFISYSSEILIKNPSLLSVAHSSLKLTPFDYIPENTVAHSSANLNDFVNLLSKCTSSVTSYIASRIISSMYLREWAILEYSSVLSLVVLKFPYLYSYLPISLRYFQSPYFCQCIN